MLITWSGKTMQLSKGKVNELKILVCTSQIRKTCDFAAKWKKKKKEKKVKERQK